MFLFTYEKICLLKTNISVVCMVFLLDSASLELHQGLGVLHTISQSQL